MATTARFGAYLPAADRFDAAMFSVPLAEAGLMDPQQRLLLEAATQSLTTHLGRLPTTPSPDRVAVYIGIAPSDYSSLAKVAESGPYHATANAVGAASDSLKDHMKANHMQAESRTIHVLMM